MLGTSLYAGVMCAHLPMVAEGSWRPKVTLASP